MTHQVRITKANGTSQEIEVRAGEHIAVEPGDVIEVVDVAIRAEQVAEAGGDLLVTLPGGGTLTLEGYGATQAADMPAQLLLADDRPWLPASDSVSDSLTDLDVTEDGSRGLVVNVVGGDALDTAIGFGATPGSSLLGDLPLESFLAPNASGPIDFGQSDVGSNSGSNSGGGSIGNVLPNELGAFTVNDVTANENAGTLTFTVTRTGSSSLAATVDYTTQSGTASDGTEFTGVSGTLSFAEGETSKTVSVTLADDNDFEPFKEFRLKLSNPTDSTIADGQGVGTIDDNEFGTTVSASHIDGSTIVGVEFRGTAANQFAGAPAGVGDVDGDGFSDFSVAQIGYGGFAGQGTVFLSGASPVGTNGVFELSAIDGTDEFSIRAPDAGDFSNRIPQKQHGDFNGDGFADIIIGSDGGDPNGAQSGEAYIVFGAANLDANHPIVYADLDGTTGFKINGVDGTDAAGGISTSAGDVNADGFDDILVTSPVADPDNVNRPGTGSIIFGAANIGASGTIELSALNGTNGIEFEGIDDDDRAGQGAGAAGDINGDGFDDFIISAKYGDPGGRASAGEAYVVFGATTIDADGSFDLSDLDGSNGFIVNGETAGDELGHYSGSTAGDLNGDGFSDIVFSARLADPNGASSGAAYVIFGGSNVGSSGTIEVSGLDGSNGFKIHGVAAGDQAGGWSATARDFNGDGYDDLLIGATVGGGADEGAVYVLFGSPTLGSGGTFELSDVDGTNGFVLEGRDANDSFSASQPIGDVNGDGFDDIMVAATTADPGGNSSAGESYLFFGGDWTNEVTHAGDASGNKLTGTSGADIMIGGRGDDTLIGNGGADVLRGGNDDDVLAVSDANYFRIDGGLGSDTLRVDGSGVRLDLDSQSDLVVTNIEIIDLTGSGNNILDIDPRDIVHLSETSNQLRVDGNAGDEVISDSNGWVNGGNTTISGETYTQYTLAGSQATLLVDTDITQTSVT